jgi:murein DD-endopeptidase MepM/ murein hydrolase activator NlpD
MRRVTGLMALPLLVLLSLGVWGGPAAASTPPSPTSPVVYVARWGDTLSGIAARFCGRADLYPQLAAASGISNPDLIYAGRTRVVLACAGATPAPAPRAQLGAGWVDPLPGAWCSSGYGPRWGKFHYGVDLVRSWGTPVRAAHAGVVVLKRYQPGGGGYYVALSHGVYQTVYMHLRAPSFLMLGASVVAGQVIGYEGASGDATGPHLHFEVHHGLWNRVSPTSFMAAHGARLPSC